MSENRREKGAAPVGVTRRDFLKTAAAGAAGIAVTGALGACATTGAGAAAGAADWVGEPPVIKDIAETLSTEVVVCGAGNGGLFAAAAAAEEGAGVLVLEMNEGIAQAREWIGAIGSEAQKAAKLNLPKNEVIETLCFYASHRCRQPLIKLWADKSGETVDWLAKVVRDQDPEAYIHIESDLGVQSHGIYQTYATQHNVQNKEKALLSLPFVQKYAEDRGAKILFSTALVQVLREGNRQGKVTGVIARRKDGKYIKINASKGVIIATGGYASNPAMMAAHNPMTADYVTALECSYNLGGGIKAAVWAGAAVDDQPTVMIFDRGGVPAGTTRGGNAWTRPGVITHIGSQPFLKVNLKGERFCNESVPYDFIYAAATEETNGIYCEIWDSSWREQTRQFHTVGCSRIQFSPTGGKLMIFDENATEGFHQNVLIPAGIVVEADTLEGLAEKLHIPVDTFVKTVKRYNELAAKGVDEDFGKEAYRLLPLNKPPYRAATLGGQLLCTLDGVRINERMEAIDTAGAVIEGLYVVGNDSGGFFANNYPELVVGVANGRTVTFGRLAGQYAARR